MIQPLSAYALQAEWLTQAANSPKLRIMEAKHDFKIILKRELEQRMTKNPRYSLRAFAKDMQIAPALMSDILNGRRGLSRSSALHLARRMDLNPSETELFCDLVESKHARSRVLRQQATIRLKDKVAQGVVLKFLTVDQEQFSVLADWYHAAILELMKTSDYRNDSKWMSARLSLSEHQVKGALERMEKLGLIQLKDDRHIATENFVQLPDGVSSEAMKSHHEQFMKKASEALYTQALEERDFRGVTLTCKKSDVTKVRQRIKKFLIELDQELSQEPGDEVYQLSTQFFCLTQPTQTKVAGE